MRLTAIVAAVVSLGVLAGCQPEAKPSAPPTSEPALTTSTPAVTSEPAPTTEAPAPTSEEVEVTSEPEAGAPEMPDDAREHTEAGAEAFVRHWVDTFNYAYQVGDPELMSSLEEDTCKSCAGLSGFLGEASDETQFLTLEDIDAVAMQDFAHVTVDLIQAATADRAASPGTAVFELVSDDGTWVVSEIRVSPSA